MIRLLLIAAGAFFLTAGIAIAQPQTYEACVDMTVRMRDGCERWAVQQGLTKAHCIPDYRSMMRTCERMRARR